MNKEVLFQPCAVWYCHNHPDKAVGNAKAITVTKDFTSHTSMAPRASTTENAKRLDSSRGIIMTNNQFSSLHAHSEIVTVLDKAHRSIADRSNTSRGY